MSLDTFSAYLLVLVVAVVVPGPTNTLIVANGMRHGTRAGLLNVAGTQFAVAIMITVAVVGLTSLVAALGHWFAWVKLAGAAYLVWIGWRMLTSAGGKIEAASATMPRGGFFLQGFVVSLGNPKQLLFFGALLPQFVDPAGNHVLQTALLGLTALAVGSFSDSCYALAAGGIARRVTERHMRLVSRIGGGFLIGGGLWLALSRAK